MNTDEKEPTLKDVMVSLASIKSTVDSINDRMSNVESRIAKVEEKIFKIPELEVKIASVEESQDFLNEKYQKQEKNIAEIAKVNARLQNENDILWTKVNSLKNDLKAEQVKRNNLEQYGRREMIEISGIPREENENCTELVHKICRLVSAEVNKEKIEIAHRIKNGDIIAKFIDRPSRDRLYANRIKLKDKSIKDIGFNNETSIYLNESLSFDTKSLLYEVKKKCRSLGYKKIITDNGIIKVKVINKWVKICNNEDLDSLS